MPARSADEGPGGAMQRFTAISLLLILVVTLVVVPLTRSILSRVEVTNPLFLKTRL